MFRNIIIWGSNVLAIHFLSAGFVRMKIMKFHHVTVWLYLGEIKNRKVCLPGENHTEHTVSIQNKQELDLYLKTPQHINAS